MNKQNEAIGMIGAGSFGLAISSILAKKNQVFIYLRSQNSIEKIKSYEGIKPQIGKNIHLVETLSQITKKCETIFITVPASVFRGVIQQLSPHLRPYHILIHGTKGLDVYSTTESSQEKLDQKSLSRKEVRTMSEVIQEESNVIKIGCLGGPNLAKEIHLKKPSATVVASPFEEVIQKGIHLLRTDYFQVYGNHDILGVEFCGALKNIIAIGAGCLAGLGYGENTKALLINRGMVEMIYMGKVIGSSIAPFIGLAGIGDLIATCNSPLSRNYQVGYRLAKKENIQGILQTMEGTAEGIRTLRIMNALVRYYQVSAPITKIIYRIVFESLPVEIAVKQLMKYPLNIDVSFLD